MQRRVAVNDANLPIGESHPRARLSNAMVAPIRMLHDAGIGPRRLAVQFEVPLGTIAKIVYLTRRNQAPRRFRAAHTEGRHFE